MNIIFRENWRRGTVDVFEDGQLVYSNRDYSTTSTWAQKTYNLTDQQLMEIYRDYKEDYDSI